MIFDFSSEQITETATFLLKSDESISSEHLGNPEKVEPHLFPRAFRVSILSANTEGKPTLKQETNKSRGSFGELDRSEYSYC